MKAGGYDRWTLCEAKLKARTERFLPITAPFGEN